MSRLIVVVAASLLTTVALAGPKSLKKKPRPKKGDFPTFKAVKASVQKSLRQRRGYRSGDILSQGDVDRVMKALDRIGWKVTDRKAMRAQTLTDGDYIVRELRSPRGVPFMRKLSGNTANYDRLDRLRRLKYGNRRIREFINNPGGYTMIQYMTTTPGGKNLGIQLGRTPGGKNFNKTTNRIYSEKQLLKRLEQSYSAEQKRRQAKKSKPKAKAKPPV